MILRVQYAALHGELLISIADYSVNSYKFYVKFSDVAFSAKIDWKEYFFSSIFNVRELRS